MKMVLTRWLLLVFIPTTMGFGTEKPNICQVNGTDFCCFNHENISGSCVECEPGYFTEIGGTCEPCEDNTYGRQCFGTCECNEFERCDKAVGCVSLFATTIKTSIATTKYIDDTTILTEESDRELILTTTQTDIQDESDGFSIREMLIYIAVAAGFIVILALSHVVRKCGKRTKMYIRQNNQANVNDETEPINNQEESPYGGYDEIDETQMLDDPSQIPPYLDVLPGDISSSSDSNDSSSEGLSIRADDTTSYLHPYNATEENWQEKTHKYEKPILSHRESNSSSSASEPYIQNGGYLSPYQPLRQDGLEEVHKYERAFRAQKKFVIQSSLDKKCASDFQLQIISNNILFSDTSILPLKCLNSRDRSFSLTIPKTGNNYTFTNPGNKGLKSSTNSIISNPSETNSTCNGHNGGLPTDVLLLPNYR